MEPSFAELRFHDLGGKRAAVSYAIAFWPKLFAASFCPCFAFSRADGHNDKCAEACLRDKHKKSRRTALTKNAAKNFGKKVVA